MYLPPSLSCCLLSTTATFSEGLVARRQDWLPIVCPTKVEGVGGGVTISRTGENWRPRGPALLHHGCVREVEDRQAEREGRRGE